jgi:hypothetical protein
MSGAVLADRYTQVVLTVIAVATSSIAIKLYSPETNRIGVHLGAPTRADLFAAADMKGDALEKLMMEFPLIWTRDGDMTVHGSVEVEGSVNVEGSVAIDGPVEIER